MSTTRPIYGFCIFHSAFMETRLEFTQPFRAQMEPSLAPYANKAKIGARHGAHESNGTPKPVAPFNELVSGFRQDHWWPYFQTLELFNGEEGIARMCEKKDWETLVPEMSSLLINLAKACKEPMARVPRITAE